MSWIDKFVELILDADSTIQDITALKRSHLPRSLFQYRSVSAQKILSLQNDEVWAGCPLFLNDPYDVHIYIDPKRLKDELTISTLQVMVTVDELEAIKNRVKKGDNLTSLFVEAVQKMCALNNIAQQSPRVISDLQLIIQNKLSESSFVYKRIRECIGVSSFSEVSDSPLMWAHYASSHTGYCVEYDFTGSVVSSNLHPAVYRDAVFECSCALDNETWRPAILSALVKSKDWSYEREWRMVFSKEEPIGPGIPVNVPTPKKLYLGSQMTSDNKEKIIDICIAKGIEVFQMRHSNNVFKMEPQRI